MTVEPGMKLGPYEIESALGAGGMGEVYRARDSRIGRSVAIKVLPPNLADNPDLRQRFDREARAISSLNHPNICSLFDVGHQEGIDFLVMEYLEGETLAKILERGALPMTEIMRIANQIADALDRAHRVGLIHRDLKPGNIIVTKNGAKLLDFGLAKLQENGIIKGISGITRSTPLTGEGAIVGTLQYMSPEQLEGKETDPRSDLFSFGVILYEMATGKKPFDGKSQASLIASILKEEPRPISDLQPLTPPALDRIVKQCLAKEPDDRWQTAGDLKRELNWIIEAGSQAGIPAAVAVRRRRRLKLSWLIAVCAGAAAIVFGAMLLMRPAEKPKIVRFAISSSADMGRLRWPKISPDGQTLAFLANDSTGKSMIWIRPLNALTAYPLPGTENAGRPFWSPDGRYLAFITAGQLKKISVSGGPVQLISNVPGGSDGTWGKSGVILYDGNVQDSIRQVPAAGGNFSAATIIDRAGHEQYHAWPCFLPDGKHFLYIANIDSAGSSNTGIVKVGSLDLKESKPLFPSNSKVDYDPAGYIIYVLNDILMARQFDAGKLELVGEPRPIAEHVPSFNGGADFSVSNDGTLAYLPSSGSQNSELVWVNRSGKELSKVGDPSPFRGLKLSPDGTKLAYALFDPSANSEDIWVRDLNREVSSRLTFDPKVDESPVWSPDGSRVLFSSDRSGIFSLMWKAANGLGEDQPIDKPGDTVNKVDVAPFEWSRDGRTVVVMGLRTGQWDIGLKNLDAGNSVRWLLTSPFNEMRPALSPDGRYLAYNSNESGGLMQVFVLDLQGSGGKWQISNNGGYGPAWSADGNELYYLNPNMIAVPIIPGPTFQTGTPVKLFDLTKTENTGLPTRRYDVSSDGKKFLINRQTGNTAQIGINIVLNWNKELTDQ